MKNFFRKALRNHVLVGAFVFMGLFANMNSAQAGCRWVWEGVKSRYVCDENRDYFKFYVQNNCNRNVRVAVHYYVAENGSGTWRDGGWYTFVPNEKAYLVPSTSRNIYIYAETSDGLSKWSGDQCNIRLGGQTKCGKAVNMGPTYLDYTYSLSCN